MLAGAAIAALLFITIARYFAFSQAQRVQLPAANLAAQITHAFEGYADEARALRAFFDASSFVTRREFTTFVRRLAGIRPGISALEWVPRVADAERNDFVQRARSDGFPDFEITERGDEGALRPAARRDVYFPVLYIEPPAGNEQAVGFDLWYDSPTRALAISAAIERDRLVLSGRVPLIQGGFGVVAFAPVTSLVTVRDDADFFADLTVTSVDGLVAMVLRPGAVIDQALAAFRTSVSLDVYLYDVDARSDRLLHFAPSPARTVATAPLDEAAALLGAHLINFTVADRQWALVVRPVSAGLTVYEELSPLAAAFGALLLAALLSSMVAAAGSRAGEVEKKVRDRTRELRESEEQIRLLANSLPAMITYVDVRQRFRFANRATERWLRRDQTTILSKEMEEVLGPDLFEVSRRPVEAALKGETASTSSQITYPDGKVREVETIFVPHQAPNGRVLGVYALALDVSDRRRLEREIESLFSLSLTPLAIADLQGRFRRANAAWYRILGYSEDEMLTFGVADLVAPADAERATVIFRELASGSGSAATAELRLRHRDGGTRLAGVMAVPQLDEKRIYLSAIDITEQRRQEEELRSARNQALAATRAKSDFLANMSHEIRTPLNAVIGFSDLSLKTDLSPRQRDYVRKIKSSGQILLELISDVLDLSKIEAGKLNLESVPFDLSEVLDNVAGIVAVKAAEKDLDVFVSIAPDVPLLLVGDSARLSQVLVNLIGNSLKFTMKGEVFVRARRAGKGEAVRFEVNDTGIGLSAVERDRLFQPFVQADASMTRRFGGTGLGLAISRQLVEAMGGEIGVESEEGKGSTFWFTVTLPTDRVGRPRPIPDGYGKRVLLADPVPSRRKRVLEALAEHGAIIREAASAEELQRSLNEPRARFDAIVLDSALGLDVADQINRQTPDAKVVVLTAATDAMPEATGGIVVLTRPLNSIQLQRALFGGLVRPTALAERPAALIGARVLLVEDNDMNQEVAIAMLMGIGASVDVAGNGVEALDIVDRANGEYHAVLMDVQMPEMDGVTATRKLRERFSARQLPIIAMTAHAFQEERDRCIAAGMNDYLTKPVTAERLTAALSRWARDRKSPDPAPAEPVAAPAPAASDWTMAGIDGQAAMRDFGFSEALFADLLGKFHRQYESLPAQLDAALAASDRDRLMKLAHTLRGSAGYVGAVETRTHAGALEDTIRKGGGDAAEVSVLVAALRRSVVAVLGSTARFAQPQ